MKFYSKIFAIFLITIATSTGMASISQKQNFKKVVWIIFENTNYSKAMKQPDFAKVAKYGASLDNMLAAVHPSQGNYINMVAGSNLGVQSDSVIDLKESHVGDILEKAGMDWRVYAEDYPGNCFTGKSSGNYVRKHVPFISFTNVTSNPNRCQKIEGADRFFQDLSGGSLPEFSLYIPNMQNDGHDTGVDFAGKWLTSKFGNVLSNPAALKDTLFIITFDESGISMVNQIYTVLVGANVIPGASVTQPLSHPALLKMIEDQFGIGNLGRNDATAPVINGIWK